MHSSHAPASRRAPPGGCIHAPSVCGAPGGNAPGTVVRTEAAGPTSPALFSKSILWRFSFLIVKTKERLKNRSTFSWKPAAFICNFYWQTWLPVHTFLGISENVVHSTRRPLFLCNVYVNLRGRWEECGGAASLQPGCLGSREQRLPGLCQGV